MTCSPTAKSSIASTHTAGVALVLVGHLDLAGDPGPDDGIAATHQEAMAKFRAAWETEPEMRNGIPRDRLG